MRTGVAAAAGVAVGSVRAAGFCAASRSVSVDSGSCLIGATGAGLAPKSNLLTGALVETGAGLSIPGMRIAPVTGARAATGAAPAGGVAGRGWSMPGIRMGVGAADAGGGAEVACGSSGAGLAIGVTEA